VRRWKWIQNQRQTQGIAWMLTRGTPPRSREEGANHVALAFGVSPLAGGGILPSYVNNIHHIVKHCATRIQSTVNEGASKEEIVQSKNQAIGEHQWSKVPCGLGSSPTAGDMLQKLVFKPRSQWTASMSVLLHQQLRYLHCIQRRPFPDLIPARRGPAPVPRPARCPGGSAPPPRRPCSTRPGGVGNAVRLAAVDRCGHTPGAPCAGSPVASVSVRGCSSSRLMLSACARITGTPHAQQPCHLHPGCSPRSRASPSASFSSSSLYPLGPHGRVVREEVEGVLAPEDGLPSRGCLSRTSLVWVEVLHGRPRPPGWRPCTCSPPCASRAPPPHTAAPASDDVSPPHHPKHTSQAGRAAGRQAVGVTTMRFTTLCPNHTSPRFRM